MRQSAPTMGHTDHVRTIHDEIVNVAHHARSDVENVDDPRARALFETSAEVLLGLAKAYEDYSKGDEAAWHS